MIRRPPSSPSNDTLFPYPSLFRSILDPAERRRIVAEKATILAKLAGLELVPDDGLLAENAGLTEWPMPLLGRFDQAFLDLPREVIQLTMRVNQKYFALTEASTGKLAPNFICVANSDAKDGGKANVEGNQKVIAARRSDARSCRRSVEHTSERESLSRRR